MKLNRNFYNRDARIVGEDLIGKILVRKYDDIVIKSRIVETEAYIAAIDKASHGYGGKITPRTKIMFGPPGYAYVYFIYGMYYCLNFVTEEEGTCSAVLIRAAEPLINEEEMSINRYNKNLNELTNYQKRNISNGPGKLCNALKITTDHNGIDLTGDEIYVEDDGFKGFETVISKRINIDYAEEAKDFLWRYTIHYNNA
ncbi:MAG TPA: DNA-3-methyladenine glycosylase [Sedimentibacter sp.]|nr:DNA-3-methyladenine glycosylase [Sedimentibacter sp.]HNZ82301.1 DNA-3-methyladenine glycosylase [Sedimentibacter sp.]HOH69350.1 DNA-3-methyladenine glycosylase [Sedimentibacter sp.]HQB62990.1 DNA-3-methyladenine glycosylase [Sedimentibacter sp.]